MVILHTPYIYSQGKRGMAGGVGVRVLSNSKGHHGQKEDREEARDMHVK